MSAQGEAAKSTRHPTPKSHVIAIIPAFNEEEAIAKVIGDLAGTVVDEVVVVDNASTDRTAQRAAEAGATVVAEQRRGYGSACLAGIAYAAERKPDVLVFIDGDYSDRPEEVDLLVAPIVEQGYDFVVGSRSLGNREPGAMPAHSMAGNRLACFLMRMFWGARYTDLGPFRAIRFQQLKSLGMRDTTYGWTIEMQIKAARQGLRYREVPVSYRRRIGQSKISGTVAGSIKASTRILWTIARYGAERNRSATV